MDLRNLNNLLNFYKTSLKLVPAIFYQVFYFSSNDSPLKIMKNVFLFDLKISFRS